LEVIATFYCAPKKAFELLVVVPLNTLKLESLGSLFKITMFHNAFVILKKDDKECNHLKHMWLFVLGFRLVTQAIFEYIKLVKLAMW
jgi:hypothetical protein